MSAAFRAAAAARNFLVDDDCVGRPSAAWPVRGSRSPRHQAEHAPAANASNDSRSTSGPTESQEPKAESEPRKGEILLQF
jgi:hypothetical protein